MALALLGIVTFALAVTWRRRSAQFAELLLYMKARFDPSVIDLSGRRHYSNCLSYGWVMKNVIRGRHSRTKAAIQELLTDKTLEGSLALGSFLGILPMIAVFLIFGGFAAVGGAFFVALAAFLFVQAPLDVSLSYGLLTWLTQQDLLRYREGDFAYTLVSTNALSRWVKILLAAGVISFILAPMGDAMVEAGIYGVSSLIGFLFTHVFIPLAAANPGVAYVVFVSMVVAVAVLMMIAPGAAYKLIKRGDDIFSLDTQGDTDESEEQAVKKEEETGNH
ncbi:MAG: hypothetical protein ACE5H4_11635 [Candidatus Thorarchaeota archaeon]